MTFTVIAIFKTLHSKKPKCRLDQSLLDSSPSGHTCSRPSVGMPLINKLFSIQRFRLQHYSQNDLNLAQIPQVFWMRALNWNLCGCAFRNLQQVLQRLKPNRVPSLETLKAHVMICMQLWRNEWVSGMLPKPLTHEDYHVSSRNQMQTRCGTSSCELRPSDH